MLAAADRSRARRLVGISRAGVYCAEGVNFENAVKITVDLFVPKKHFSGPETIAKCRWFLIRKFSEKTFFSKNSRKFVEFVENGHKRVHGVEGSQPKNGGFS